MIAVWLTVAAWAGDFDAPATVLDAPSYRFCLEEGVDAEQARAYCALLDSLPPEVCPGMRATCAGAEGPESGCGAGGGGGEASDALMQAPSPSGRPFDLGCAPPDAADWETPLRWAVAIAVGLLVLVLARLLAGYFGRHAPPTATGLAGDSPDPADAADALPNRPAHDLLTDARAALRDGRHADAVLLARGAVLRGLSDAGRLTLHRARTDREYLRHWPEAGDARSDLTEVVRSAEAARWAGARIGVDTATRALTAAARLLGLGLLLVAAAPAHGADRYGPSGDAGLYDLWRAAGYAVSWRQAPLTDIGADTQLLVLDLGWVIPTDDDWTALRAWVEGGGVLVLAGDGAATFPELGPFEVGGVGDGARAAFPTLDSWLIGAGVDAPHWPGPPGARYRGGEPLLQPPDGDGGWLVEAPVGRGVVLAFADDLLLANGALVSPENRSFLAELPQLGQGRGGWPIPSPFRIELATRAFARGGGQGCGGSETLARGRLLTLVLQTLAVWALVAWARGARFGLPRDPPVAARARFADHAEALARRLWRVGDRAWADRAVARLWWGRLGDAGLRAAAARAGAKPAEAAAFAERVGHVVAGADDPEVVEALWRMMQR
jgi:hypothetical protein